MQTSAKKACFQFAECSFSYTKKMQILYPRFPHLLYLDCPKIQRKSCDLKNEPLRAYDFRYFFVSLPSKATICTNKCGKVC